MYATARITTALEHLKCLFLDTPYTQISVADAARLTALDARSCEILLEALHDVRFLTRDSNGLFMRTEPAPDDTLYQ